ncbi:MAG: hypothetical protein RSE62_03515 [Citrobacter sp.]
MNLITAIKTAWRNRALLRAPTALALTCEEYSAILALRECNVSLSVSQEDGDMYSIYLLDTTGQGFEVNAAGYGHILGGSEVGG